MEKNNMILRKKIEMILRQNLAKLEESSKYIIDVADEIILYLHENYDIYKK